MTHKCNICGRDMKEANDIKFEGRTIRGWRCRCGNAHSHPDDVDKIVHANKKK